MMLPDGNPLRREIEAGGILLQPGVLVDFENGTVVATGLSQSAGAPALAIKWYTQLAKMSFDGILDLEADAYFYLYLALLFIIFSCENILFTGGHS